MAKNSDQIPGEVPGSLVSALRRILYPLVRLLLKYHITYPMLIRLLKGVYVDVAANNFKVGEKPQTDSRISLLTGVHRKDVKQFREEDSALGEIPENASLGARVISTWTGEPEYLDKKGYPKPLARFSSDNERYSFEELVRSINKDIRPRSILDEWLRLGVIHLDDEKRVWLNVEAYVPEQGFEDKIYYFGSNVSDHIAAAVHNITGGSPPMLDRNVFSENLSFESVDKLKKQAKKKGMEAIQAVNRQALRLERQDAKKTGQKKRINFGIYFYEDSTDSDEEQGND